MSAVRAISGMMLLNGIGSLAGLLTSITLAYMFGTSRAIEIFFAAAALQMSFAQMAQAAPIGDIFLPIYHKVKEGYGREAAFIAFSVMLNYMLLFLAILCAILYFSSGVLVDLLVPGFGLADKELVQEIFTWLLPVILVRVVVSLFSTLANAEHWFGLPEGLTAASRIVNLSVIVIASPIIGVWALVLGRWMAEAIRFSAWVVLLFKMRYRHHAVLSAEGFSVWDVVQKLSYNFSNVAAQQLYVFVLTSTASFLPQGSYAVFKYVRQLFQNVQMIALRPIVTVFFTQCSVAYSKGASSVRDLARTAISRGLIISTIAFFSAMVVGENVLQAIWGNEHFGPEKIEQAQQVLIASFTSIYILGLSHIWRKTALVADLTRSVFIFQAIARVMSSAAAYLLVSHYGFSGLVLTVIVGATFNALSSLLVLRIWRRELIAGYSIESFLKWGLSGVCAYFAGIYLLHLLAGFGTGRVGLLVTSGGVVLILILVALMVAWVLNISDIRVLASRISITLGKRLGRSG